MKKFKKIVIGYVFYTFPLTLVGYAFLFVTENRVSLSYGVFLNTLIYVSLIQTLIWTLTSLFLSISLFFSQNNRDVVLKKLSGIKERDEREIQIVGRALKSSYLTTMTILFFLLFISFFHVQVCKKSSENVEPGQKAGSISFGLRIGLFDKDGLVTQKEGYDFFYQYNNIPISTQGLIIILLVWQIVSYRFVSRRTFKLPHCPRTD